ncbi:hypothetical protein HDV01_002217 [Terramyces sp. JEL0728]|nr:hypothetical protein HDV01_002217 [Terramyces sp. JEL0728]
MITWTILAAALDARMFITSQWWQGKCNDGPPNVMYHHSIANEGATAAVNETWPVGYSFQARNYKYYNLRCFGTLKAVLSEQCCAYPLVQHGYPQYLTQAGNYKSVATVYAPNANPLSAVPQLNSDTQYCALTAATSTSLKGYADVYYLADSQCTPAENIICNSNGTMNIYPSAGCTGTPTVYDLTAGPISITTAALQTVNAQYLGIPVGTGQAKISYTIMISTNPFIPDFTFWADYMTIFMPLVSVLLLSYSVYYHGVKLWRQRKPYLLINFITQIIFLFFVVVAFMANVGFYSKLVDGLHYTSLLVATILSIILSFRIIYTVQPVHWAVEYGSYFLVVAVNVCLTWNNYVRFMQVVPNVNFNQQLVSVISVTNLIWYLLYYFIDCIPPLFIIYKLITSSPDYEKFTDVFKIVWAVDKWFAVNFMCQFTMVAFFILEDRIKNSTEWLKDDRVWLGFLSADSLAFAVHGALTAALFERMSVIIKNNMIFSYGSKSTAHSKVGTASMKSELAKKY